jgi:hypothetical protein
MAKDMQVICVRRERKYFCKEGWTGVSPICPSGALMTTVVKVAPALLPSRANKISAGS